MKKVICLLILVLGFTISYGQKDTISERIMKIRNLDNNINSYHHTSLGKLQNDLPNSYKKLDSLAITNLSDTLSYYIKNVVGLDSRTTDITGDDLKYFESKLDTLLKYLADQEVNKKSGKVVYKNAIDSLMSMIETSAVDLMNLSTERLIKDYLYLYNTSQSEDELSYLIEQIKYYTTIHHVYSMFNQNIGIIEESDNNLAYILGLKRNLKVVEERMNYLSEINYSEYRHANTSSKLIKGVNFHMDNDVFYIPDYFVKHDSLRKNQDRNYTGGAEIEITTDLFKMRFFNPWDDKILSYQGIIRGTQAYTPYIKLKNIIREKCPDHYDMITENNSMIDSLDRPWASFQYYGRSKYRMHYRLPIKLSSKLKFGEIGGNMGNVVQSVIHRDQSIKSVKPYGWDKQIANGGRFAWNIDHELELMLCSRDGVFWDPDVCNLSESKNKFLKDYFNLGAIFETHVGNELTAFGGGLSISNLSLREISGTGDLKVPGRYDPLLKIKDKEGVYAYTHRNFNWLYQLSYKCRYVQHNTMLEGFGLWNTFEIDEYDDAPIDHYVLQDDQINRFVHFLNLRLGVKYNKTTVYIEQTFISKEFHIDDNSIDIYCLNDYLNDKFMENWYVWGRIGFNFKF